jgi:thiamine-monophosphate kinase
MDELALIEKIRARLTNGDERVRVGIGDDAAVLAPLRGGAVLSVDVSVDAVHFDRRWLSMEAIGRRAFVSAMSDLAAMGATPVTALLSYIIPPGLGEESVLALVGGAKSAADALGATIAGGNLSSGSELSITTTVVGEANEPTLRRAGARVGDGVFVTGTLGAAGLGLRLLAAGRADEEAARSFVLRWCELRARFDVVDRIRAIASACVDVSDGLVQDLVHICDESGTAASIELARLPTEPGHFALAASIGEDGAELALTGGEDHELLFTAPADAEVSGWATRIGEVIAGRGVTVRDEDGSERALSRTGHRHFAR